MKNAIFYKTSGLQLTSFILPLYETPTFTIQFIFKIHYMDKSIGYFSNLKEYKS